MSLVKITYDTKTNLVAVTDVTKQATAEDFNEIKAVVNAIADAVDLLGGGTQSVFAVYLPTSGSAPVSPATRISGAYVVPAGWTIAVGASPVDIVITHGLGKRVASVTVFAITGTEQQQLFGSTAFNGVITADANTLKIQSFATIAKELYVYIVFNQ